jgi:hypothetical protein
VSFENLVFNGHSLANLLVFKKKIFFNLEQETVKKLFFTLKKKIRNNYLKFKIIFLYIKI